MSDLKITAWDANPPTILIRSVTNGRDLLRIEPDGTVTGEIEDASEAARVFVEHIRRLVALPTQRDGLREIPAAALDALRNGQKQIDRDGVMVGVSRQALDEVLAALQEQSK